MSHRILIVGDVPALCGKLSTLCQLGYEIATADTGQDALWLIEEPASHIAVVVAADQLADMDGIDLIRAIVRAGLPAVAVVLAGDRNTPHVTVRTARRSAANGAGPVPLSDPVAQIIALLT